jgi:hypothetical protein
VDLFGFSKSRFTARLCTKISTAGCFQHCIDCTFNADAKIVSALHRLGTTLLFKSEKSIVRNNPIIALQLLLKDAKDTLKRVKEKISHVDGVRIDMITSGTQAQKNSRRKIQPGKKTCQRCIETGRNVERSQQGRSIG